MMFLKNSWVRWAFEINLEKIGPEKCVFWLFYMYFKWENVGDKGVSSFFLVSSQPGRWAWGAVFGLPTQFKTEGTTSLVQQQRHFSVWWNLLNCWKKHCSDPISLRLKKFDSKTSSNSGYFKKHCIQKSRNWADAKFLVFECVVLSTKNDLCVVLNSRYFFKAWCI